MVRATLFLIGVCAYAQAPCATEAFKRYDYVLGEWAVVRDGKPVGNVRYRKAVHGCVIVEDYNGPGGISRKGLLFYDSKASRWEIVVAGTDGLLEGVETAPGVFTAGGGNFRLATAGEGWSIAQDGAWKQVYAKSPYPAANANDPRHCDSPMQKQFDFWLGKWEVFNPRGALAGTNHIYAAARGCALVENWTAAGGFSTGISLNFWDTKKAAWRQIWVAPGGVLKVEGTWDGAALRFASPVSRLTFTPNQDGSIRQFWEQTAGGKVWSVAFDGTYRRAVERSREDLLAELDASERATLAVFESVSEAQSKFRQAEGRWSLNQILHHLVLAESVFTKNTKNFSELKQDKSLSGFDPGAIEAILTAVVSNRNVRLNAPEPLLPEEQTLPLPELIAEYRKRREESKALARTGELRGFRTVHPLGASNLDAYQWLFTIAAHNRRHLQQAEEVMADPRYPGRESGLRRWSGLWKGAGKFNGRDVDVELSIKEQLGGKFDELNINIKIGPGQSFQGRAMYGPDAKASWSDSYGNAYPVPGAWVDGKLVAQWGDPIRGRSTYGIAGDGGLEVLDEVKRNDGSYIVFGRYQLNKVISNQSKAWDIRSLTGIDTASSSVRVANFPVGSKLQLSVADRDEIYFIDDGRGVLEVGSQHFPIQPGTIVQVPKGVAARLHAIDQAVRVLVLSAK